MIIGITGGIGSGKTYCARIFEEIGIPVYYSDDRAKQLMITSESVINAIKELLGDQAYAADGSLDRAYIASQIFSDKEKLSRMNAIVHPAVRDDFMQWGAEQLKTHAYILQESALMYETGSYKLFSKVIVVDAPIDVRIKRVISRDNTSAADVQARIDKQLPSAEKREKADYIIENDGIQPIIPQVIAIHRELLNN